MPGFAAVRAFPLFLDVSADRAEDAHVSDLERKRLLAGETHRQQGEAVAGDDLGQVHAGATLADIDRHEHEGEKPCMSGPRSAIKDRMGVFAVEGPQLPVTPCEAVPVA